MIKILKSGYSALEFYDPVGQPTIRGLVVTSESTAYIDVYANDCGVSGINQICVTVDACKKERAAKVIDSNSFDEYSSLLALSMNEGGSVVGDDIEEVLSQLDGELKTAVCEFLTSEYREEE